MLAPFARRPLTQSPRYLRCLSAHPRVVPIPARFATARFSSTSQSDSNATTTTESDLNKNTTGSKTADGFKSQLNDEDLPLSTAHGEPIFSEGSDADKLYAEYKLLADKNSWRLTSARTGVYKTIFFKSYARCLDFAHIVGVYSKNKNHHPDMMIRPNGSLKIYWTTHSPTGLSEKDIYMAKLCDEQARLLGGVTEQ